jgi:hypothetical protein
MNAQTTVRDWGKITLRRNPMLSEAEALAATAKVGRVADQAAIAWALAGGFAMSLYDSPRYTKDIDIIAAQVLPVNGEMVAGGLRQGGERYSVQLAEGRTVPVDWIVRSDDARPLFDAALADATEINGLPVITPEWLVILKLIAGRFKDQEDGVWLLRQPKLVDRRLVKKHIARVAGRLAWVAFSVNFFRWCDLADGKSREGDENESYRPL